MSDIKKDHSIGEGTGAVTGAVTGAAVGSAAGPVGTVVGAIAGGVLGAKAGGSIAEAVNPTEYNDHWKNSYRDTPYYNNSREWIDYEPAYKYGYDTYGQYRGQKFDDVEIRPRAWLGIGQGEFAPGLDAKRRVRCATVGITSNAPCRATPTATVADRHRKDSRCERAARRAGATRTQRPPRAAFAFFTGR